MYSLSIYAIYPSIPEPVPVRAGKNVFNTHCFNYRSKFVQTVCNGYFLWFPIQIIMVVNSTIDPLECIMEEQVLRTF